MDCDVKFTGTDESNCSAFICIIVIVKVSVGVVIDT